MRARFLVRQLQPFDGSARSVAITLTIQVTKYPSNLHPVIHKDNRGEENARGNIFQDADGG